mmetsp:Transcript_6144/g.8944  ORF Transcript_6144/g.8944 Transcript_6144/m.8944 type:complete len:231 (+) Transcript_6144:66-758(+)
MKTSTLVSFLFSCKAVAAFTASRGIYKLKPDTNVKSASALYSTTTTSIDPKEAVKIFGRLAEKYIMLDASAGMCCYSACTDCEYREPGGGYRMPDQSAARPKWIPCYEERRFANLNKEHVSKWSTGIFTDGPCVTKKEFVERVVDLEFFPTLGGPYTTKTKAGIDDTVIVEALFDLLVDSRASEDDVDEKKELKLTRFKMSKRMKDLADGQEGLTWQMFIDALDGAAASQ